MTTQDYAQAGYSGMESMRPPYASSSIGQAFECGVWCKKNGITLHEVKAGRGYSWIVNRVYKLNFKNDDHNPEVTRV